MSKKDEIKKYIEMYKLKYGSDFQMPDVVKFAMSLGYKLPTPEDPLERAAKRFADVAREEVRYDSSTKRPYRAYHHYKDFRQGKQLHLWIDIDDKETVTKFMVQKSFNLRREQMVGDGLQLSLDLDHWNSIRPEDDHFDIDLNINPDVEWRKAAMDDGEEAA